MRKFLFLAIAAILFAGCSLDREKPFYEVKFKVIVLDSCEYIYGKEIPIGHRGYGYLAHKGNCRFCKERMEKRNKE
jgi:hypothetical protein